MANRSLTRKLSTVYFSQILALLLGLTFLPACTPSASQLKQVMEDNPDILYAAIRKNPAKFLDLLEETSQLAKTQREREELEGLLKAPPLTPKLDESRLYAGAEKAPITIVEYSDFQCPFCAQGHEVVNRLQATYPTQVRVLMKNLPMDSLHPQARKMAQLFEAIVIKDKAKALEFKSLLFENYRGLSTNDQERAAASREALMAMYNKRVDSELAKMIKGLGLNPDEIKKLSQSEAVIKTVEADTAEARGFGFTGTPGYIINGVPVRGLPDNPATFNFIIDHLLAKK